MGAEADEVRLGAKAKLCDEASGGARHLKELREDGSVAFGGLGVDSRCTDLAQVQPGPAVLVKPAVGLEHLGPGVGGGERFVGVEGGPLVGAGGLHAEVEDVVVGIDGVADPEQSPGLGVGGQMCSRRDVVTADVATADGGIGQGVGGVPMAPAFEGGDPVLSAAEVLAELAGRGPAEREIESGEGFLRRMGPQESAVVPTLADLGLEIGRGCPRGAAGQGRSRSSWNSSMVSMWSREAVPSWLSTNPMDLT